MFPGLDGCYGFHFVNRRVGFPDGFRGEDFADGEISRLDERHFVVALLGYAGLC